MASLLAGAEFMPELSETHQAGNGRGTREYGLPARVFNATHPSAIRFVALLLSMFVMAAVVTTRAEAAPVKLMAFGDSLTAGYGLRPEEAYPVKLQTALKAKGYDVTVINAGVSGDTTAGGLARLDWALADHPDYALVELGANDMLRGLDPAAAKANLEKILAGLAAAKVKVLLMGMKSSSNWGPDYQQQFDRIYPDLAAEHHLPLYPFFLDGVALDPKLNQPDMLHPLGPGVDVIVARTLPAVMALLGPPGTPPS
jgi:acyl-CoA thioesterase I